MIQIKTILPDDVEKYWVLRLEALKNNPEAFGATYEESINQTIDSVRARIGTTDDNFILGSFTNNNEIVGMVGFKREHSIKTSHKGYIWGMYISSKYRKLGLGKMMLQEVLNRTRKLAGLEQINLCVVTSNQPARELYKSLGFKVYGLERNALKHNGYAYDEELMTLTINNIQ